MAKKTTTIRLNDSQKEKVRELAAALDCSAHAVIGMLVDNAEIVTVQRRVATATLSRPEKQPI